MIRKGKLDMSSLLLVISHLPSEEKYKHFLKRNFSYL